MKNFLTAPIIVALCAIISGCGATHNTPNGDISPNSAQGDKLYLSVDSMGDFYPDHWEKYFDAPERGDSYALIKQGKSGVCTETLLENATQEIQARINAFTKDKERLFVFVHGYNNSYAVSDLNYRLMEQKINLTPRDGVIYFHWDGLVANPKEVGPISSGKIWFYATGNSGLAGIRGLRRVLTAPTNATTYIIAHSRGAHVVISALSRPKFAPNYECNTNGVYYGQNRGEKNLFNPIAMHEANPDAKINILFLAPAIGRVDFEGFERGDERLRKIDLDGRVQTIGFSINPSDFVLNKCIFKYRFNPTDFSLDSKIHDEVLRHYETNPRFIKYPFLNSKEHSFDHYIADPGFDAMLRSLKIAK